MLCKSTRSLCLTRSNSGNNLGVFLQQRNGPYFTGKSNTTNRNKRRRRKVIDGKHTQVRINGSGRQWCYFNLNMPYDKKFYLPFMNILRNEGYYTPYWLDLHPMSDESKLNKGTPNNVNDAKVFCLPEWNNEEGFNDPDVFELRERSNPHKRKPGKWGPPPSIPPQILRMQPPKPTESDLAKIEQLKKTMDQGRLYTIEDKYSLSRMLK
mmetsp:Transcript_22911/g.36786  ORF Transcript_22911/g.36786 Transcript_22911/m.36786 type:complete len:209 (-) Transcript_22911:2-628(-)